MNILKVEGLKKSYNNFNLNVSFALDKGYIMGFIGSNGAGKTTTIKSILDFVHPSEGIVEVFGKNFKENELEIKQDIGLMLGGANFYSKRKIKDITKVYKRFYVNWDEEVYNKYLKKFNLDPAKRVDELSEGMKVKYSLSLALSHNAKLIILDEPTSGLDPVARDKLLKIFQEIVEDGERSILFSTHITSDLEKCADYITYINNGKIIDSCTKDDMFDRYRLVMGTKEQLNEIKADLISYKENSFGFTGLIESNKNISKEIKTTIPSLDDIMIYYAIKEENNEESTI